MKLNTLTVTVLSLVFFAVAANAAHHEDEAAEKGIPIIYPPKVVNPAKATRPAQATLVEPAALSMVSSADVTLKWNPVETADHYVLQVATDPNFKWPIYSDWNYKGTSFDVKGVQKGQVYYWRVAGVNSNNSAGYTQGYYSTSSFEAK
jgi:hypothetical protein